MWKTFTNEDSQEAGGSLFSFNNYLPEKVETKASSIQVSPNASSSSFKGALLTFSCVYEGLCMVSVGSFRGHKGSGELTDMGAGN